MMKAFAIVAFVSVVAVAPTLASEWKILPEASTLSATGEYYFDFGGGPTSQRASVTFPDWAADISLDPNDLAQSRIHIEVNLLNAKAATEDLTKELIGPGWLNAQQNRKAVFVSAFVTFKGDNAYEAVGKLTLNGVTK